MIVQKSREGSPRGCSAEEIAEGPTNRGDPVGETGSRRTSQILAEALGRAPRAPGHGWWGFQANLSGDDWGVTPKANYGGMSLSLHVAFHRGQSRSMPQPLMSCPRG